MISWVRKLINRPKPATTEEVERLAAVLTEVCGDFKGTPGFGELVQRCDRLNPHQMFVKGNLGELTDAVFKTPDEAAVLLGVTCKFFMVSGGPRVTESLSLTLAEGLCLDGPDTDLSVLPETIRGSLPIHVCRENSGDKSFTSEDLASVLVSNKHLIVVLLMHLFKMEIGEKDDSSNG